MVERNEGHIINIGSVAGSYPYAGGNVYGATKGARATRSAAPLGRQLMFEPRPASRMPERVIS